MWQRGLSIVCVQVDTCHVINMTVQRTPGNACNSILGCSGGHLEPYPSRSSLQLHEIPYSRPLKVLLRPFPCSRFDILFAFRSGVIFDLNIVQVQKKRGEIQEVLDKIVREMDCNVGVKCPKYHLMPSMNLDRSNLLI